MPLVIGAAVPLPHTTIMVVSLILSAYFSHFLALHSAPGSLYVMLVNYSNQLSLRDPISSYWRMIKKTKLNLVDRVLLRFHF